jgi:hypothetical protein
VFHEVGEALSVSLVVEASQSGSIVVVDEGLDELVSLVVGSEAVLAGVSAAGGMAAVDEAAIEALGHAGRSSGRCPISPLKSWISPAEIDALPSTAAL